MESLPNSQQDEIAAMILDELADDERWTNTFERKRLTYSSDSLARLSRMLMQDALPPDPDIM